MPPRRKKLAAVVKVQLPAGQATPAPPVGTALGPLGVNIMDFVKQLGRAKFDESVEVHVRTGLNVRHADEQLRGTLMLPHGSGKDVRVAVFAEGDKAREALPLV